MQGIYNYIPKTNKVSTVYNVTAIMWSNSVVYLMVFPTKNVL